MTHLQQSNYPAFNEVFDEAVAKAIGEGLIHSGDEASVTRSYSDDNSFYLKTPDRRLIAKYPKSILFNLITSQEESPQLIRKTDPRSLAAAWGRSLGYKVPQEPKPIGCLAVFGIALGLLFWIVPGLLIIILIMMQRRNYESEINKIVGRWNDAGRPEPGVIESATLSLHQMEDNVTSNQTESSLLAIDSLKEKGLISEVEYDAMRRKVLGI